MSNDVRAMAGAVIASRKRPDYSESLEFGCCVWSVGVVERVGVRDDRIA